MQRAPGLVGVLFGIALALLITLLGPLLLFNPPFVAALQDRHQVADRSFNGQREAVDAATAAILVDIWRDGPFDAELPAGMPVLNDRERSHMHDVSVLVRVLGAVVLLAAIVAAAAGTMLRREPDRLGRVMLTSAGVVGTLALVVAIVLAVAFEPAFLFFHEVFFPPGTYLFEPGSNLIGLFPEAFWFDAALIAGATIVLSALVVVIAGMRLWRGGSPTPSPA
jgi:integral membrane protein (TIGR01906 family)